MSDQSSELVEISKLNGDFRRNYGKLIGAYLYLDPSVLRAAVLGFGPASLPSFVLSLWLGWRDMVGRCQSGFDLSDHPVQAIDVHGLFTS